MFRNTPLANTPTFKLILGLGLCTLSGAMLYAYFKTRDEDDEAADAQKDNKQNKMLPPAAKKQQQQINEKPVTIKLEISNEHIPLLVGRAGANINILEEKTRTKIRFR